MIVIDSELPGTVSFGTQPQSSNANKAQENYLQGSQLWEGQLAVGVSPDASTALYTIPASSQLTLHLSTLHKNDRWDPDSRTQ